MDALSKNWSSTINKMRFGISFTVAGSKIATFALVEKIIADLKHSQGMDFIYLQNDCLFVDEKARDITPTQQSVF
jgi:hypothetical protein